MVTIHCGNVTFPNISAIIFDKDGTLEDSEDYQRNLGYKRARLIDAQIPGISEPLLMAFGIEGDKINPRGLMRVGSRKENEIASAAYIAETGRDWIESLAIAHQAFNDADQYLKNSPPSPLFVGSLTVLETLFQGGLKLAILSAATTNEVENFVQTHELAKYFQVTMGVDSTNLTKPDPALFLQTCAKLGVDPAYTLMVGDSLADIEMAKNAHAAGCIAISWKSPDTSHFLSADVVISHLDQLLIDN